MVMSNKEWDDVTPPSRPAALEVMRNTAERAEKAHSRLDSLDEAVGQILSELASHERRSAERLDSLNKRVDAGFERIGELLQDLHEEREERRRDIRRTDASHHDLSEELARTKRIAVMKNASIPTAIVIGVVIVCYTVLLVLHIDIPTWMGAVIAAVGTGLAGMLPALLGQGKAS